MARVRELRYRCLMARMTLNDFFVELRKRGFDGFADLDIYRYINFGYFEVGRLTRWSWQYNPLSFSMDPGDTRKDLSVDLPTLRTLSAVLTTTPQHEFRLAALTERDFLDNWAAYDLSASQQRGEPDRYYLTGQH